MKKINFFNDVFIKPTELGLDLICKYKTYGFEHKYLENLNIWKKEIDEFGFIRINMFYFFEVISSEVMYGDFEEYFSENIYIEDKDVKTIHSIKSDYRKMKLDNICK